MRHKTMFRLAMKVLGVFFFLEGLHNLVFGLLSTAIQVLSVPSGLPAGWNWWRILGSTALAGGFKILLGGYLFFRGRWIVDLAIPSNRPYCPQCAYDLQGASSGRCPECGVPFRAEDIAPPASSNQ